MLIGGIKVPATFTPDIYYTGLTSNSASLATSNQAFNGSNIAVYTSFDISNTKSLYSSFNGTTSRDATVTVSGTVTGVAHTESSFSGFRSSSAGKGTTMGEAYFTNYFSAGGVGTFFEIDHAYEHSAVIGIQSYQINENSISVYLNATTTSDSGFTVDTPLTHTDHAFFTMFTSANSFSFVAGPQTRTDDLGAPFGCTITTIFTTDSFIAQDSTTSTDTFSFPTGSTTTFSSGTGTRTGYTTVSISSQTTTWNITNRTLTYDKQRTTFYNEANWNRWASNTIIFPQLDLTRDDWIWLVYPSPANLAQGEISSLGFSIDSPYTITPATTIPRIEPGILFNMSRTSALVTVTNHVLGFATVANTSAFTTATNTTARTYFSNTTSLPMVSTTTVSGYQTLLTRTLQELSSSIQPIVEVMEADLQSTALSTNAVTSPVNTTVSWRDANANVSTLMGTSSWFTGATATIATNTTRIAGFGTYSQSASGGSAGYSAFNFTQTRVGGISGIFNLRDVSIYHPIGLSLNPFAPGYPYTSNDTFFQIQPNINISDGIYRGLGANVPMPFKMSTKDVNGSTHTGMFKDEAGAFCPFMFFYNGTLTSSDFSGMSSFTATDRVTWKFKWDTDGIAQMSVSSQSSGFAGTATTIVSSGSFINSVFGLGDPISTITQTYSTAGLRGTAHGGYHQPSAGPVTLLLGGAYSTTRISDDVDFGSTFYSDYTTITIDTGVLIAFERTSFYNVSTESDPEHLNFFAFRYSKHTPGTFLTFP